MTSIGIVKNILTKVTRLADALGFLLSNPPSLPERWPEWTERLTAVLAQYENLLREMKPLLLSLEWQLVPSTTGRLITGDAIGLREHIPNNLLRTRLPPEVEESFNVLPFDGSAATTAGDTRQSTVTPRAALRRAVAKVFEESVENCRMAAGSLVSRSSTPTSVIPSMDDDERLVQAVKQLYTLHI